MFRYVFRRLLQAIPVVIGVVTLTFLFLHITPGDPVDIFAGDSLSEAAKLNLKAELGLDQPIHVQYFSYWSQLFQLDLGRSLLSKRAVSSLIGERLWATTELAISAMLLALLIAIPFSLVSQQIAKLKALAWIYSVTGLSLPAVVLGPSLIWLFAIELDLLPISDREEALSIVLPALSLAIPLSAVLVRVSNAALEDVSREPFVQVLKAKGLSEKVIWAKHILKKALTPILTISGLQFGALITGTVITESIFDWPGIGMLLFEALTARDFPLVQGLILLIALVYVMVNLATDLLSAWVNPHVASELFNSENKGRL